MEYDEVVLKFVETHALALMREPMYHSYDYTWFVGFKVLSMLLQHNDIQYSPSRKDFYIMGIKVIRSDDPWTIKLYKEVV